MFIMRAFAAKVCKGSTLGKQTFCLDRGVPSDRTRLDEIPQGSYLLETIDAGFGRTLAN